MRFSLEHRFDAPIERVEAASNHDAFHERLVELPTVAERTIVEQDERPDGSIHRVIRYRFEGTISPGVQRVIGTDSISWDEVGDFDPSAHRWSFRIVPAVFGSGFECRGSYTFRPDGPQACVRVVDVDMRVKVPIVGRLVENAIRDGLVDTMNAEARMLDEYLRER